MRQYAALLVLAACDAAPVQPDASEVINYDVVIDHDMVVDTSTGPLTGNNVLIAEGATVRFKGDVLAGIVVEGTFRLDGVIDISAGCDDGTKRCPGPGGGIGASEVVGAADFEGGGCSAGIPPSCDGSTFNHRCHGGGGGGGGQPGALGGGTGGIPRPVCATVDPMVAGSGGARGIAAINTNPTVFVPGGGGGGALHVVAHAILIHGTIDANGEGGGGGVPNVSGGGGGAGGTILFEADRVEVAVTSIVAANGGGGGGTGGPGAKGQRSADAAAGGPGVAAGGTGGSVNAPPTSGVFDTSNQSGGGGGGAGLIGIRATTAKLDGVISPAPIVLE